MPNHRKLLIVFFTKKCHIRLYDVKQFGDHRCHTRKMPNPTASTQVSGDRIHLYRGLLRAVTVHLLHIRGKQNIALRIEQ